MMPATATVMAMPTMVPVERDDEDLSSSSVVPGLDAGGVSASLKSVACRQAERAGLTTTARPVTISGSLVRIIQGISLRNILLRKGAHLQTMFHPDIECLLRKYLPITTVPHAFPARCKYSMILASTAITVGIIAVVDEVIDIVGVWASEALCCAIRIDDVDRGQSCCRAALQE